MKKCPSCKNPVSPKAETCPGCGHPIKKKASGCAVIALAGLIGFIIITAIGANMDPTSYEKTSATKTTQAVPSKTHKEGDTVSIGYTTYVAWQSYWTDRLTDNPHMHKAPDAKYLVVEVSVRNDDKKERSIPPFKLVDESGREYGKSSNAYALSDHIGPLSSLNPDVQKDGYIVFDCPPGRTYALRVSGGYWSSDSATIALNPH